MGIMSVICPTVSLLKDEKQNKTCPREREFLKQGERREKKFISAFKFMVRKIVLLHKSKPTRLEISQLLNQIAR